jgi:UDP-glucose 4-epimerase
MALPTLNKLHLLVTGGAGYIGSHLVKALGQAGARVTVLDDLSNGNADAVLGAKLIQASLSNETALEALFKQNHFDGVFHFASFIQVSESVSDPLKYYVNNIANTLNLLKLMQRHNVSRFVFSSTAAIFGQPQTDTINENHPKQPINPYGSSKKMVEDILADLDAAYGLRSVSLRYFNAAGADPEGQLGERHDPETHLIPIVLEVAAGKRSHVAINGNDYPTRDGTCVRDYVHVTDLAQAHLLAYQHMMATDKSHQFNLGNNTGYSILEVIQSVERVTGRPVPVQYANRRIGDPTTLVADSSKIKATLGWSPQYSKLDIIVAHAWAWETRAARGA